jgi:S-adenosylmethionine:tRNA ribosyltransferase-isomerase
MHSLSDFDFDLPPHLIAQTPAAQRDGSRLLQVQRESGVTTLVDRLFPQVLSLLGPNDALVMNNTKVIAARIVGKKASGGKVEMLVERVLSTHQFLAQIKASHKPKVGQAVFLGEVELTVAQYQTPFVVMNCPIPVLALLDQYGSMPLPPYIARDAVATDSQRYQTVYAQAAGAVAAPTAGLHWTEALLAQAQAKGIALVPITLHVGAGTFSPVRSENLSEHQMHSEWYNISESAAQTIEQTRKQGGKVVSIGTTTLRALESSAAQSGKVSAGSGETRIFITPGFPFKVVDALITNFHLPKSTLMMLVSAFAGYDTIRLAYAHAIEQQYRFFSYGDAMWLERNLSK